MFDLRSDTVTRPTAAMREAMARAEVGDDVFGDDPTVLRLERRGAEMFGKEAGLFVPSGTMANQVCIGALTHPGEEMIVETTAHVVLNEVASAARLWGVQVVTLQGTHGLPSIEQVAGVIREPDIHHPVSALLSLENTHNFAGGVVLDPARVDALLALAHSSGLRTHLDGARVFNAAVATGLPLARLAQGFDLVSCCLSKGLGAPVGSLVLGTRDLVATCRRLRKALGGGMRQVGILAAAGLMALEEGPALVAEDHRRAKALALELAKLPGCTIDPASVETNLVFVTTRKDARAAERTLAEHGVQAVALSRMVLRFAFHRDLGDDALDAAIAASRAAWG
jgi:threonine aldolase